ncbi:hypothetical protein [Rahnella sp. ChDrAdgB13]|uniref:hypothetical protein n=1 Tax=Rahnella sp. ChDrAdgB13 TaxID=1850581 RepID=UPI001AD85FDE|nr:hypothetical protein [Rahnella sp. ChDrAdgB13]
MNSHKVAALHLKPSRRLVTAGVLFLVALAVSLFRPAPPVTDDGVLGWHGEVKRIFTDGSSPVISPEVELTLSASGALTVTTPGNVHETYRLDGMSLSRADFFQRLRDEKIVCLTLQPGGTGPVLKDIRVTDPVARIVPVTGSACSASLRDFRQSEPGQENQHAG